MDDGNGRPCFRGRLAGLDGLRGLAILLVLVLHLWRPEPGTAAGRAIGRVAHAGWTGVDLFFVLSGFLITGLLIDGRGRPGQLRAFFARRVLRIFPLYYLFLALTLLAMPLFVSAVGLGRVPGYQYDADAAAWPWYVFYASNVLMAAHEEFSPGYANSLTWSLAIEEQFYLLWPLVVAWCAPRRLTALLGLLCASAVAVRTALVLSGTHWMAAFVLLPCRLDALAAGGLLAAALRAPSFRPDAWRRATRAALLCLPLGLGWVLASAGDVRETAAFQAFGYSLLAAGWAGLLALVLEGRRPALRRVAANPVLRSFGRYSYAIYLFHLLLFVTVYPLAYRRVLGAVGRVVLLERIVWLLAGVAGSWLLAAGLHQVVEKPFLRLKRRFAVDGTRDGAAAAIVPEQRLA